MLYKPFMLLTAAMLVVYFALFTRRSKYTALLQTIYTSLCLAGWTVLTALYVRDAFWPRGGVVHTTTLMRLLSGMEDVMASPSGRISGVIVGGWLIVLSALLLCAARAGGRAWRAAHAAPASPAA